MKRITFLTLSFLLLSGCSLGDPPLSWREASLSESTKTYRISGAYPVIVGLPDADQFDVNTKIKQIVEETLADFRRTAAAIPPEKLQGNISTLKVSYERATLTNDLVSFGLSIESSIAGAAHPNSYVRAFNYDLVKRLPILITDLTSVETLSVKTRGVLTEAAKARGTYDHDIAALIDVGTDPTQPENFRAFLMESGSIILLFNPNQVAPGSEGVQRVSIDRDALR